MGKKGVGGIDKIIGMKDILTQSQVQQSISTKRELIEMKGFLEKQGCLNSIYWHHNWCVLKEKDMIYYKDKELTQIRGKIPISKSRIFSVPTRDINEFQIQTKDRIHYFRAVDQRTKKQWFNALNIIIKLSEKAQTYQRGDCVEVIRGNGEWQSAIIRDIDVVSGQYVIVLN